MPDAAPTTETPAAATPPPNGATPPEATPPATPADAKPPEEPMGKTLAAMRAREKRLLEEQTRFRREQDQERARREQEARAFAQERTAWEQERQRVEEARRQEVAAKDPSRYMLQEFQREREASNRKIAELEQRLARQEQADMTRTQQANVERELTHVTQVAKAASEDRPHVAKYADRKESAFRARVLTIAREHIEQGVRLTDDEILDKIEEELAEEASIWAPSGTQRNSAPDKAKTPPTQSAGTTSTPAPTLTSARQGERVQELTPGELAKMTPEQRKAHTLALLAQMRRDREAAAKK